jgi:hypothetical protein
MRSTTFAFLLAASTLASLATTSAQETVDSRIGPLSFTHDFANGHLTHETVKKLMDEMDSQRAGG